MSNLPSVPSPVNRICDFVSLPAAGREDDDGALSRLLNEGIDWELKSRNFA
jgi:hypothetical protein